MIRVKVKRDGDNRPVLVEIRGHALFAPQGSDIVCAAVSILVQTMVFAMEDLLGIHPPLQIEKGFFSLAQPAQLAQDKSDSFFLLVETMLVGLKETARSYPENLSVREVKTRRSRNKAR